MPKSKRKRHHNDDDDESPRRYSRRLNTLKEDGTPVRRSARLAKDSNNFKSQTKNSTMKTSARKSLAISITQSARIASRSKSKKSRKSYELKYRSDKSNNLNPKLLVSQSQETNNNSNDAVAIVPRNLEEQFLNGLKRKSSQNSHISRDLKNKKLGEVNTSSPKQNSMSQHSLKTNNVQEENDSIDNCSSFAGNVEELSFGSEKSSIVITSRKKIIQKEYNGLSLSSNEDSINNMSFAECEDSLSNAKYASDSNTLNDCVDSEIDVSSDEEDNIIKRICYCDMLTLPLDCTECNRKLNVPCDKHTVIKCHVCGKKMHKECLKTYLGEDLDNMGEDEGILCLECLYNTASESDNWNSLGDDNKIKLMRLGLFADDDIKKVNQMIKILSKDCEVPSYIINAIKDNDPKPYPSITPITHQSKLKHAICGRRFDVSMMMYNVQTCDCCGFTMPFHKDRFYPNDATFEKKHFNKAYYKAWHCSCDAYCKGSQYYASKQTSSIKNYEANHNGLAPWEFLNLPKNETNAIICSKCNIEIRSRNTVDLQFARSFSFRNGFGSVHLYPKSFEGEDPNFDVGRELQDVMLSLSCAEEAAIRQITPLVSLVRLSTGSISMRGNTSCVWQESKLNIILPNLPSECKFVVIKRKG